MPEHFKERVSLFIESRLKEREGTHRTSESEIVVNCAMTVWVIVARLPVGRLSGVWVDDMVINWSREDEEDM